MVRQTVEPERAEQIEILRRELRTLAPTLAGHGFPATLREEGDAVVLDVDGASIRFQPEGGGSREAGGRRVIVLTFGGADARDLAAGVTLFDLAAGRVVGPQDALSDEVREFCRRRGIRFRPYAWRYGAGHFEGDEFRGR